MKQVTALILVLTLLTGCTGGAGGSTTPMHSEEASVSASLSSSPAAETEAPPVALNIALVHTLSGLGDKSMNDNAFSGLEMAAKDFGITFTNVEPKEASDFETMLMQLSNSGEYDLIFSMSNEQLDALEKVAPLFPEQKYSAISYICEQPIVSSLYLKFEEFVFTAGYLAGALTKSGALPSLNDDNVIGIVYARDVPVQTAPAVGYIAGAKLANGDVEVLTGVVGDMAAILGQPYDDGHGHAMLLNTLHYIVKPLPAVQGEFCIMVGKALCHVDIRQISGADSLWMRCLAVGEVNLPFWESQAYHQGIQAV